MTTPPPESTPRVVAPTAEETRALANAASDEEIRALAQQILASTSLGFTPVNKVKAVVTAISSGTPPTVSIQISGDTTTTVSGVRLLSNYSPVVGQTVLLDKQGPDVVVVGHTADVNGSAPGSDGSGWILADLTNGSHDGNNNGDLYYRRVLDHGSWKMQWQGGWNTSGSTTMIDTADALGVDYRPTSLRSLMAARNALGAISVKVDFQTDGKVVLVGGTTSTSGAESTGDVGFTTAGGFTSFDDPVDSTTFDIDHSHGVLGGHDHSISTGHDHTYFGGSHSHTVATPTWVSFNGLEYFL